METNTVLGPIKRGTTFTFDFIAKFDNMPIDLTGATVYFTVKTVEWDTDDQDQSAVIQKTLSPTDPVNGVTEIELTPQDTNIAADQEYYYDIRIKNQDGKVYAPIEGRLRIDGSPTNRSTS